MTVIKKKLRNLQFWKWLLLLVGLDQLSKQVAAHFKLVRINPGASFGWGDQLGSYLLLTGVILVLIASWFFLANIKSNYWAFVLFIAGGISNAIDRFLLGGVRDWLWVPVLNLQNNLADWFIVVGLIFFLFEILVRKPRLERKV